MTWTVWKFHFLLLLMSYNFTSRLDTKLELWDYFFDMKLPLLTAFQIWWEFWNSCWVGRCKWIQSCLCNKRWGRRTSWMDGLYCSHSVSLCFHSFSIPYLSTTCNWCILLQNSSLPWILPKKTLGLDLGNIAESISDAFGVRISAFWLLIALIIFVDLWRTVVKLK